MLDSPLPDDRRVIALLGLVQISEEGMDNLELAKECGLLPEGVLPVEPIEKFVDYQDLSEALNEFASRLTADKDAEIERINALVSMLWTRLYTSDCYLRSNDNGGLESFKVINENREALSATSETVSAWQTARDEKVKCEFAMWLCTQTCVQTAAMFYATSELRAKGE